MNKTPRVIKVIDEYKVVLNIGDDDGVKVGQIFVVYAEDPEELTDPDTGENLGKLEIVRGRGKVTHVQQKMSTIESTEKGATRRIVRKSSPLMPTVALLGPTETEEYEPTSMPFEDPERGDFARRVR